MPLLMFQIHDSRQNTQILLPDNIPQQHIILNTAHIRFKKDNPNGGEPITVEPPEHLKVLYVRVPWLTSYDIHTTSLTSAIPIPIRWGNSRISTTEHREVYADNLNMEFNLSKPIPKNFAANCIYEKYSYTDNSISIKSAGFDADGMEGNVFCSVNLYFTYRRNMRF